MRFFFLILWKRLRKSPSITKCGKRDLGRPPERWSRLKGLNPEKEEKNGWNHFSRWGIMDTHFSNLNQYWIKFKLPTSTKIYSITVNVFGSYGTRPLQSPRSEIKIFNTIFHCFLWFFIIQLFYWQNNCIVNFNKKRF